MWISRQTAIGMERECPMGRLARSNGKMKQSKPDGYEKDPSTLAILGSTSSSLPSERFRGLSEK